MTSILSQVLSGLISITFALQGMVLPNQNIGAVAGVSTGNQWYVSSTGSSSGNGSQSSPWDLQTALNHPSQVQPGDTIWLLAGSYTTPGWTFNSKLKGTAQNPIKVRGETGKRVTIDGSINAKSSYTWYMDFEIWQSKARGSVRDTECITTNPAVNYDPNNPVFGDKFIHLVIHDCSANGIGGWRGAEGNEFYGNLIYFVGDWHSTEHRGIYHGIYGQNVAKTGAYKEMTDNIIWGGWNEGIQTYSSGNPDTGISNYKVTGNTIFLSGILWGNLTDDIFVASGRGVKNYYIEENMTYGGRGSRVSIYNGVDSGRNIVIRNNYMQAEITALQLANTDGGDVSGNVFISKSPWVKMIGNTTDTYDFKINNRNVTMSNNKFYGPGGFNNGTNNSGDFETGWKPYYNDTTSQNFSGYPTGVKTFVRPSKYETGRANVTIYNWDKQNSVSVDLSSVLKPGDKYEVRDSQNYFGQPVLSGTYNGGSISFPMNLTAIASPVSSRQPAHTSSEFNSFIVRLAGGGGATLPPPTTVDNVSPSVFAGLPSGKVNSGSSSATLSVSTNEAATCKYSTSAGVAFDSMSKTFTTTGNISHFASVSGLTDGAAYAYYVRCRDLAGNTNTSDYSINFAVSAPSTPPPPPSNAAYQYYEAESGSLVTPITSVSDSNSSGGKYITSSVADSGTASYGFNAPATGSYVVWMRILAPNFSQDSIYVSMDGTSEDVFDMAENKWSSNWQWVKVNGRAGTGNPLTLNPKLFSLTAGSHTLKIRGREVGFKVDKILITNDQGFVPTDGSSQPTTPPTTPTTPPVVTPPVVTPPVVTPPVVTPPPASQASGAAVQWTFDSSDISGNSLADKSGNNLSLNLSSVGQNSGKYSQAGSFNGSNSFGNTTNSSALNLSSDLTITAWVKTTNSSRLETILGKYNLGGFESGYLLRVKSDGHIGLRLGGNNLSNIYDSSIRDTVDTGNKVVNDGQWHHIAVVIKLGQGVTFYVDGVQTSTHQRAVVAAPNNTIFSVGRTAQTDYGYGANFTGDIDEVKIYTSALNSSDISAMSNSSSPTQTTQTTQNQSNLQTPVNSPVIPNLTNNDTNNQTTPTVVSPSLTRDLALGDRGDDVTVLQQFLVSRGYTTADNITGYFGPTTQKALQNFQKDQQIVSSGTPESTGFGAVGPLTRAKINSMLQTSATGVTTPATESLKMQIEALQKQVAELLKQLQQITQ